MKESIPLLKKTIRICFGLFLLWVSYRLLFRLIRPPDDIPLDLGFGLFFLVAGICFLPFPFTDKFLNWAWIKLQTLDSFLFRMSPYLVLLSGSMWIAWILFNPPLYVMRGNKKLLYDSDLSSMVGLYPTPDYITTILHSIGIAVITGMIFYLLKKVVAAKTEKK